MIHPNKEALTNLYDGREQIQMGISLELLGIVFVFHTLLGRHWCCRSRWLQIRSAWMMGGTVDSDCVIDWAYKLETKRRGEGNIDISMGIYCQWWFSALCWFDGGRGEKLNDFRVSMSFGLRCIHFGGILAPPNHWLAVIDGSHNTLVGGNKSSWWK